MARVTVEDCKKIIPNHFELVVLASRRGRDISTGSPILVERSNDKNGVVALREIAGKKLNIDLMRENLLNDFRKNRHTEDSLEDNKQENYLEMEVGEENKFANSFEEELEDDAGFALDENAFLEDDMSFEDEELDAED